MSKQLERDRALGLGLRPVVGLAIALFVCMQTLACGEDSAEGGSEVGHDACCDAKPDATDDTKLDLAEDAPGGDDASGQPFVDGWEVPPPFVPRGAVVEAVPEAFTRINAWATSFDAPTRPDTGHLGAFGIGNGHVFGLIGHAKAPAPTNALHGFVGPTYERNARFFGDYELALTATGGGAPLKALREQVAHSLSAPTVLTRQDYGGLVLESVDFAPWTDDLASARCALRLISVRNEGALASDAVELRVRGRGKPKAQADGSLLETLDKRSLVAALVKDPSLGAPSAEGNDLRAAVEALDPEEERTVLLQLCTFEGLEGGPLPGLDVASALDLLRETSERYRAWDATLVAFDLPDPMVSDLLDGLKQTLKLQTSIGGASCPMSQYTRTWARDNIGAVLAMLAFGGFEEVTGMMDYIYSAVLYGGDLSNSYAADLDFTDLPPAPDWDAMAPLAAKVAGETPSYMVSIYGHWYRWAGTLERISERWGFLRRCLFAQGFGPDGLLPWTGDETFRAAMNVTFGLGVDHPHHEDAWSANSGILWLGASLAFQEMAAALDEADDEAAAVERFEEVEAGLSSHYALGDGCLSALLKKGEDSPWPAPFEDVSLKATWAGWLPGDDPRAAENVSCLIERVGRGPGVFQSPIHEMYIGVPIIKAEEGVYTGMLPGYTLAALTDVGHPDAAAAFDAIAWSASSSGNYQEYLIYDDHSGLTVFYNESGAEPTDYTAKYRPWEGGINAAAMMQYLVGLRPRAAQGQLSLRPHLPEGWPRMAFRGLRMGDGRFDLEVAREASGGVVIVLSSQAEMDLDVSLRWDADGERQVVVNDASIPTAQLTRREHFGAHSTEVEAQRLPAGGTLRFQLVP